MVVRLMASREAALVSLQKTPERVSDAGGWNLISGCKVVVLIALFGSVEAERLEADPAVLIRQLRIGQVRDSRSGRAEFTADRPAGPCRPPRGRGILAIRKYACGPALAQKIESGLLTQASRVRLDFDNRSLADVVKSLSEQAGFKIELYPANPARWRQRKIQLREAEPLDFWKAIDRVCDAGNLQYNAAMHGHSGPGDPSLSLTEGIGRTLTPISDHGPFRVEPGRHRLSAAPHVRSQQHDTGSAAAAAPGRRGRATGPRVARADAGTAAPADHECPVLGAVARGGGTPPDRQ